MRITIIAKEEFTHKVLAGFKDDFSMSGLGRLLDVLLKEGVDALVAISAIANLDGMTMVAHMNTNMLSGVIGVDVENFGVTWCNAFGSGRSGTLEWIPKAMDHQRGRAPW